MNRLNTDHSQVNRLLDQILSGSVVVCFVDASNRRSTFNRVNQSTVLKKHDVSGLPRHIINTSIVV